MGAAARAAAAAVPDLTLGPGLCPGSWMDGHGSSKFVAPGTGTGTHSRTQATLSAASVTGSPIPPCPSPSPSPYYPCQRAYHHVPCGAERERVCMSPDPDAAASRTLNCTLCRASAIPPAQSRERAVFMGSSPDLAAHAARAAHSLLAAQSASSLKLWEILVDTIPSPVSANTVPAPAPDAVISRHRIPCCKPSFRARRLIPSLWYTLWVSGLAADARHLAHAHSRSCILAAHPASPRHSCPLPPPFQTQSGL